MIVSMIRRSIKKKPAAAKGEGSTGFFREDLSPQGAMGYYWLLLAATKIKEAPKNKVNAVAKNTGNMVITPLSI